MEFPASYNYETINAAEQFSLGAVAMDPQIRQDFPLNDNDSTTKISCTTIFKNTTEATNQNFEPHTFPNISVDRQFLTVQAGVLIVNIGTLLLAIQNSVSEDEYIHLPPIFRQIFNPRQGERVYNQFDVATSRAADFGEGLKNIENGYRFVGNLAHFEYRASVVPTRISSSQVFAIGKPGASSPNAPRTMAFIAALAPFGISAENHFILIFFPSSSTVEADAASVARASGRSSSGDSPLYSEITSAYSHSRSQSPFIRVQNYGGQSFPGLDELISPAALSSVAHNIPAFIPPTIEGDFSTLDVPQVLDWFFISNEERQNAQFGDRSSGDMYSRIVNFYAFRLILSKLGFDDKITSVGSSYKVGSLIDKLFRHFGWSSHSYMHKLTWYTAANRLAQMEWKNDVPKSTDSYRTWLGIKAMWGRNGFLEKAQRPQKNSRNSEESAAANLTQKSISDRYNKLDEYLISVDN